MLLLLFFLSFFLSLLFFFFKSFFFFFFWLHTPSGLDAQGFLDFDDVIGRRFGADQAARAHDGPQVGAFDAELVALGLVRRVGLGLVNRDDSTVDRLDALDNHRRQRSLEMLQRKVRNAPVAQSLALRKLVLLRLGLLKEKKKKKKKKKKKEEKKEKGSRT